MSIFAANKKWLSIAQTAMSNAETVATQQRDINVGRELLNNIRQYRIQKAALEQAEGQSGEVKVSGLQTGIQFLQQQVEQPYQRALDDAERQEQIAEYQRTAQAAISRYKKQAKTARTTGFVTALINPYWAMTAMATGSTDSNFTAGAVEGTTTAAQIAATIVGGIFGGPAGASAGAAVGGAVKEAASGAVRNTYTLPDGGATMTAAAPPSQDTGWSSSHYQMFGKILSTIGGAVKNINGYEAKVPVSQGYTGQNYSQYVQSFRGFA